jgi:hypothetical protein
MEQFVDALPKPPAPKGPPPSDPKGKGIVSISADVFDRYVGEYKTDAGTVLTFRRDGMKLLVKPGSNAEVPLIPRSQTRFADPRGPFIEFQLDSAGKATGLIVEQGNQKTAASRIK